MIEADTNKSASDPNKSAIDFIQKIVEKLSPSVLEAVTRKDSGHFEIHFSHGAFQRAQKQVTL